MRQNVKKSTPAIITRFDLPPGRIIAGKYEILERIGSGWQGEVYQVREINTHIIRAAKLFFPHRNIKNRTLTADAEKLHKLRQCSILVQYHTQDTFQFKKNKVAALISEFVEGEKLSDLLKKQPDRKFHYFEGLHLLYALSRGVEDIHAMGEYHGDLHMDNVIVKRVGIQFDVKLFDLYHWGGAKQANIQYDVYCLIRLFYDIIGGRKNYASHPKLVKSICCGLKRSHIRKKFTNAGDIKRFIEQYVWD